MKITRRKSVEATTSTNRKISAARVGKTKEVIVLQGNYGYGWDDLVEYDVSQSKEAKDDLKTYRTEEKSASHRLIHRRITNPDWVAPADRFSVIQYDGGFRYKMGKPVKFSDMEEAIAHATDLWKHGGFEVVLKDAVTGCNIQLIPLDEYRTEKNLRIFRETVESDESISSATSTRRKSVKANTNAKRRYVSSGYKPPYAVWVFDGDDNMWKTYKASNTPDVDAGFLDRINHIEYPNYTVENNYTDVVVLPNDGSEPDDGRPVKEYTYASTRINTSEAIVASEDGPLRVCRSCLLGIESHEGNQVVYDTIENYAWDEDAEPLICDWCEDEVDILYQITPDEVESSTSTKRKYTVKASADDEDTGYTESDNLIYEREQFVTNLIHELEDDYRIKVSNDAWGQIMDLARDLSFGAGAERHGSTPQYILEDAICDIVEKDTGIVIGSTDITADSDTRTMRERFINPDDFVFFFNGEELYRGDGDGFSNVIAGLCKDESTNQKFQEWCNQFGDPFDFDGTPKDTAYVFKWLVDQERTEQDDFYLDGFGILNFEMWAVSGNVESSTDITADSDIEERMVQIDDQEDLLLIGDKITSWTGQTVSVYYADITNQNDWTVFIAVEHDMAFNNFMEYILQHHKDMYNALNTSDSGIDDGCIDAMGWDCELTPNGPILKDGSISIRTDRGYDKGLVDELRKIRNEYADYVVSGLEEAQRKLGNILLDYAGTYASTDITAAIGGKHAPIDDKEYYTALAEGAVNIYNSYWETENLMYEVSDSAIAFSENGNIMYILPLDNITPNWEDLDDDIEELGNSIIGSNLPF